MQMFNSIVCVSEARNSRWTWEEDKIFEDSLAEFLGELPNQWERIAARLGSRSAAEVEQHFAELLDDVAAIDAGCIQLPEYSIEGRFRLSKPLENPESSKKQSHLQKRKAARPWTDAEHRLFLIGLERFGKGDWKSISRCVVKSRSPAQIASHAQKYYVRQEKEEQQKKRKSIFDKTVQSKFS